MQGAVSHIPFLPCSSFNLPFYNKFYVPHLRYYQPKITISAPKGRHSFISMLDRTQLQVTFWAKTSKIPYLLAVLFPAPFDTMHNIFTLLNLFIWEN